MRRILLSSVWTCLLISTAYAQESAKTTCSYNNQKNAVTIFMTLKPDVESYFKINIDSIKLKGLLTDVQNKFSAQEKKENPTLDLILSGVAFTKENIYNSSYYRLSLTDESEDLRSGISLYNGSLWVKGNSGIIVFNDLKCITVPKF